MSQEEEDKKSTVSKKLDLIFQTFKTLYALKYTQTDSQP